MQIREIPEINEFVKKINYVQLEQWIDVSKYKLPDVQPNAYRDVSTVSDSETTPKKIDKKLIQSYG